MTPVTGQYLRPGALWACYPRSGTIIGPTITDHDASDENLYCVKVDSVIAGAKLAYYGVKLLEKLARVPIPPP